MRIHLIAFGTLLLVLIMSAGVGYSMWAGRLRVNVNVHIADDDKPFIDSYKGFICCETTSCCDHGHCHDDDDCGTCSNDQDTDNTDNMSVQCHHCHPSPSDCDCKGLEDDQMRLINNGKSLLLTSLDCEDDCHCCCHDHHDEGNNNVTVSSGDMSIECHHCHHDHYTNMSLWIGLVIKHEGEVPVRLNGVSVIVNGDYDNIYVSYYAYGPFTTSFQEVWGLIDPCNLPLPGYGNSIVLEENEKTVLWINVKLTNTSSIASITITPVFENWNE